MITPPDFLPILFAVFWKSGVALGAALGVSRLLRKKSADLRRLVLSTTVVAMLAAAAVAPVLPRLTAPVPSWFQRRRTPAPPAFEQPLDVAKIDYAAEPAPLESRTPPALPFSRRIDLVAWLIPLIWCAGAALLLARFGINLHGLHCLRRDSEAVTDSGLLANLARLGRRVRLLRNQTIGAPVTWGIVHPIILLPVDFEHLPAESREAVLRHEMAHIRAHDFLMRGLSEIARALIWFQPLMWIVWRQLREEQELACDIRVLAGGGKPSTYAKLLLDWDGRPGIDSLIAVGIAHRSCLKRRLYALLDPDLRRDTVARSGVAGTWLLGIAAALALAAVSFTQTVPAPPASPRPTQSAAPVPVVTAPEPPVQLAQVQAGQSPAPQAPAQTPAKADSTPLPKFDVASIKPCQPGDGPGRNGKGDMGANRGVNPDMPEGVGGYFRTSPGRLDVTCGSLLTMIGVAYIEHGRPLLNNPGGMLRVTETVQGIPKWALAARYTIHAVTDDPLANGPTQAIRGKGFPPASIRLYAMLQTLLEDRFQLKLHREETDSPMYALTVAKGGLKLKPMRDGDCLPDGSPEWPEKGKPPCGWVGWDTNGPNRRLLLSGITVQRFADTLAELVLDRNVIDRTGLTMTFVSRLEYEPDENTRCLGPAERCKVDPSSDTPGAGTILSALERQFGLKLEPIKGRKEYIKIDHVEQPSEN
jgi:uncharacterized protein (TIGR03435 family)